ncbi:FUSC family protein [Micromonospora aurantiaca (nom. illeg.)]|uniref:FUSC family protein n=1 Tax=Micromonospora aurantiaca (nom. illeg.) TaxID=47850 RepID=UPI0033D8D5EB
MAWVTGGISRQIGWGRRRRTLELYSILAVQAGVAAMLAWTAAHEVLGHEAPIFAPSAAVGTIAAAIGRRTRRTIELLLGVLAGIVVGEALISFIGTGPWQTGVVVALAILVGLTLSRGGQIVTQAGGTAVLIAAITPTQRNLAVPRIVDAVVGGLAAVLVVAALPANPLRIVQRAARPVFAILIEQLDEAAEGMSAGDADRVSRARDALHGIEPQLGLLNDAISGAQEAVAVSPIRWHQRAAFEHYRRGAQYLTQAIHGTQELLRRAATAVRDGEPMPRELPVAVHTVGDGLAHLQIEAEWRHSTNRSARLMRKAVERAGQAYAEGVGFSGSVVVAQVRTVATDLLTSLGQDDREASAVVRESFGQRT